MVSKLDLQTIISKFDSFVLHYSSGLVPSLVNNYNTILLIQSMIKK